MRFGFSWVGLVFLAMLLIPNLIYAKNPPQGYASAANGENKLLLGFERVGQALLTFALLFSAPGPLALAPWSLWLAAAALLMLLYECYWVRYFRSPRTLRDLCASFAGVPVAGATLPVCAAFLLGVYGKSPLLMLSAVIFGIGHVGIHLAHRRSL